MTKISKKFTYRFTYLHNAGTEKINVVADSPEECLRLFYSKIGKYIENKQFVYLKSMKFLGYSYVEEAVPNLLAAYAGNPEHMKSQDEEK